MNYIKQEEQRQLDLLKTKSAWFNHDKGGGGFGKRHYPHLLRHAEHNLWEGCREDALRYFEKNTIKWHTQAHNLKSSQVSCVNHLMLIRKHKALVLEMLNGCSPQTKFVDLLPLPYEADETYIGFEVVSGADWLNEGLPKRGSNCTSIDALIYAVDKQGKKWLIPIEWKYTEHYYVHDKGAADGKGETRHTRYDALIQHSQFLKPQIKKQGSIYYQEPFYQLMRQTLWAEQIIHQTFVEIRPEIKALKVEFEVMERFRADAVLHLHIIPRANKYVVPRKLSQEHIEALWRRQLANPACYRVIDPKDLFAPIAKDLDADWLAYLEARYW